MREPLQQLVLVGRFLCSGLRLTAQAAHSLLRVWLGRDSKSAAIAAGRPEVLLGGNLLRPVCGMSREERELAAELAAIPDSVTCRDLSGVAVSAKN